MNFKETSLEGVWLIEPRIFEDGRGHFLEAFRQEIFRQKGLEFNFVQDNISTSVKGTLRGLHYQIPPWSQAKLVMAIEGEILDVAVDLRKESPTFGRYYSATLNYKNRKMILVPAGFAHGFSVLSENATVFYKCNQYYHKASERGLRWNDPSIDIDWQIEEPILSEKDQSLPLLKDIQQENLF